MLAGLAFTPFVLPLLGSAAITLGLGLYALMRRRIAGASLFALCMFGVVEWSVAYAVVLAGTDLPTKILAYQTEYLGVATIPTCWLLFAIQHSRWQRSPRLRTLALLALQPCLTLAVVWTNARHGLMWPTIDLDQHTQPVVLALTFGPYYWFKTLY
jgi:hypothetical protein